FAGYATAALGVVGLGVGTVFGLMRNAKVSELEEHCDLSAGSCVVPRGDAAMRARIASLHDRAETYATVANVGFIVGGLALAGGLVLVFTAPSDEAAAVTLGVAPGGVVLTAHTSGM